MRQTKVFGREYNLRHDQNQITALLFIRHYNFACIDGFLRSRRKITGIECAARVPAWSLGAGCGSCLHSRRSCWTFGPDSAKRDFPRLVRRARPHRHCLLADLSSALALRHASQLEWTLPCRATFPHCHDLCCDRCSSSIGFIAFQYFLADIFGQHPLHYHSACGLCHGSKHHAPTAIPNLQFRSVEYHTFLRWVKCSGMGRGIFPDTLLPRLAAQ